MATKTQAQNGKVKVTEKDLMSMDKFQLVELARSDTGMRTRAGLELLRRAEKAYDKRNA
jgi:hypothetical protein